MTCERSFSYKPFEAEALRGLAERLAAVAATDRNAQNRERWRRVNDLRLERPVVMCCSLPWNELNVDDELTLVCENGFLRRIETEMRRQLYMLRHMPMDMVVEPYVKCGVVMEETGYGADVDEYVIKTDETNSIAAHQYNQVIHSIGDVEKLRFSQVRYDAGATAEALSVCKEIFDGILDVAPVCVPDFIGDYGPWDYIVKLMGAGGIFINLIDQPELMKALAKRYHDIEADRLEQYERLGVMTQNLDNALIGSGGYGYTSEIPPVRPGVLSGCSNAQPARAGEQPARAVKAGDLWGSSRAQLFSDVSTEMFKEFAVDIEQDWLNRFPLSYYGCCEALDKKIPVLKKLKTLRKISISAWADPYNAAEQIDGGYVYSFKPDPAMLATDALDEDRVRKHLETAVGAARAFNCPMEIMLKTLSTVLYNPQKLWRWAEIAQEVVESA